jgi:hypothetical protein
MRLWRYPDATWTVGIAMAASQDNTEHDARAAAILDRRASGLISIEEAIVELADADCEPAIAALVAERVRLEAGLVLRALEASDDQAISVMCRAAGFKINGYSAVLRMRRRHGRGTGSAPTDALTFFSSLSRASAERIVEQLQAVRRAS